MKENREKVAAAHINAGVAEVRRAAIDAAADVIWEQVNMYERLLDSSEAWEIYLASTGETFINLCKKRRTLNNKKGNLISICAKLNDLKRKEQ